MTFSCAFFALWALKRKSVHTQMREKYITWQSRCHHSYFCFIWEKSFPCRRYSVWTEVKILFPKDGKGGQRARQVVKGTSNISLLTISVSSLLPLFLVLPYLCLRVCIFIQAVTPSIFSWGAINAPPSSWCLLKMRPTPLSHQSPLLIRLVASSLSLPTDSQFLHLFFIIHYP